MGCLKKREKNKQKNEYIFFLFPYNFGCKMRMSVKPLISFKVPIQPQEFYDWFHKISSFMLLLISELLQHKTVSEKEWTQQIQSSSRMFWILAIINIVDAGNWKIVDILFVSEMHCELTQLLQPQNNKAFWCNLPCLQNHVSLPPSRKSHLNLMFVDFLPSWHGRNIFFSLVPISLHFIWNRTQRFLFNEEI